MTRPIFYPLFLGVDGGATRSRGRLEDAKGTVLATAMAGPANVHRDRDGACRSIEALAHDCLQSAGLRRSAITETYAGLGLAGLGQQRDRERMAQWRHPFLGVSLTTDAHVACLGAFGGRKGTALVVGTGSCAVALVGARTRRVGGWGFPISDGGSGAWLGLRAIQHALAVHDGVVAAEDPLSETVLDRFENDPEEIVAWARTARPSAFAELAPLVVDAAGAGVGSADAILSEGGRLLSDLARAALIEGSEGLAVLGGLSATMTPYLDPGLQARIIQPKDTAEAGAVLLAKEHIGYDRAPPGSPGEMLRDGG